MAENFLAASALHSARTLADTLLPAALAGTTKDIAKAAASVGMSSFFMSSPRRYLPSPKRKKRIYGSEYFPDCLFRKIPGRRLHRQVGWLLALEDAVDVAGGAVELVDPIRPISDQPPPMTMRSGGCRYA